MHRRLQSGITRNTILRKNSHDAGLRPIRTNEAHLRLQMKLSLFIFLTVSTFGIAGLLTHETEIGAAIWDWLAPEPAGSNCAKLAPCRRSETTCGFGMQPYYLDGEYQGCMKLNEQMPPCLRTLVNEGSFGCKPDSTNKYICVCP